MSCVTIPKPRVVFSSTRSPISRLIRFMTGSKVSHAMLQFEVFGEPLLLHADVGGIQFTPRKHFERRNNIVNEFEILRDVPRESVVRAIDKLNERYDYRGLVGFVVVWMLQKVTRAKFKNPLSSQSAVVCSEFVAQFDPEGNALTGMIGLDPETTTPEQLLSIMIAACVLGEARYVGGVFK